jgi:2-succinyl-5-enolpyruvyl-6-hydroxy-3-cyclohexene-1-carboxylate synthase
MHHRQLGCRAYFTAAGDLPGPVHLNFPLREPLSPEREALDGGDWEGRADGRPWTDLRGHSPAPPADAVQTLAARVAESPRGAIVCGASAERLAEPVTRLAAAAGWPVLAEPTSGVRCGGHDRSHVVAGYDVLLRDEAFAAAHVPDLVLRVGDTPTSKPLRAWLGQAPQVLLDPHASWHEPTRTAELILHGAAAPACDALAAVLGMLSAEGDPVWLASWCDADARVPAALDAAPDPFEPKAWAALEGALPDGSIAWLSSSMPVRDVEAFFPSSPRQIRFLANRGANGIDGVISSAAGAARATGAPVTVLTGELALLHDVGGLLAAARAGTPLTVVCANNGGGGIFDFLPVAGTADPAVYEEHIATPVDVDLAKLAALAGMDHRLAATAEEVRAAAAAGPGLVEFRTERAESVRLHRELAERVISER